MAIDARTLITIISTVVWATSLSFSLSIQFFPDQTRLFFTKIAFKFYGYAIVTYGNGGSGFILGFSRNTYVRVYDYKTGKLPVWYARVRIAVYQNDSKVDEYEGIYLNARDINIRVKRLRKKYTCNSMNYVGSIK